MSVAQIHKSESVEFLTPEGCWIVETWNDAGDAAVSVARARVQPGVTTKLHRLRGVVERYVIVSGNGFALIGGPDGTSQQVVNDTAVDLIFYCICSPRFTPGCYEVLE
jgi:mannose-6-phosphate isomerase-like protein (cupin superfamily)